MLLPLTLQEQNLKMSHGCLMENNLKSELAGYFY